MIKSITANTNINCLFLQQTPLVRNLKHYRKRLVSQLPALKFLDDRPVSQQDHRLSLGT